MRRLRALGERKCSQRSMINMCNPIEFEFRSNDMMEFIIILMEVDRDRGAVGGTTFNDNSRSNMTM
jgi:hypothetical protein